jgi:hypothetical protein
VKATAIIHLLDETADLLLGMLSVAVAADLDLFLFEVFMKLSAWALS